MARFKRVKALGFGTILSLAFTGAFLLASFALTFKMLFPQGQGYRAIALEEAQRVEFSPLTGEIEGKLLLLEEALPKKSNAAGHAEKKTPEELPGSIANETPSPEAKPAEHSETEKPVSNIPQEPAQEMESIEKKAEETPSAAPEAAPPAETAAASAPDASLPPIDPVEKHLENGDIIPVRTEQQLPMQYYAMPEGKIAKDTPRIAVLLTDLGLNKRLTDAAIALPNKVTLSFSPYGKITKEAAQAAREIGHELMLDLPLQTGRSPSVDPGPDGLLLKQNTEELASRFTRILARARGYIGLATPPEDSFSSDPKMLDLLDLYHRHGLLMVNSNSQATPMMFQAGEKTGTAILYSTILLTRDMDATAVKNELARAEDLSRRYGKILINAEASALIISLLDTWLQGLAQKQIALVPVSAIAPPPPPKYISPYAGEFEKREIIHIEEPDPKKVKKGGGGEEHGGH